MLPHVLILLDLHTGIYNVHSSLSDTMSMFWMYGHTPAGFNIYEFRISSHFKHYGVHFAL